MKLIYVEYRYPENGTMVFELRSYIDYLRAQANHLEASQERSDYFLLTYQFPFHGPDVHDELKYADSIDNFPPEVQDELLKTEARLAQLLLLAEPTQVIVDAVPES